jgi:glycosyltransferase involved in cell wall biosynthesis
VPPRVHRPGYIELVAPPDIVIIGGWSWDPNANQTSLQTVRQLATRHRVLYLHRQIQSSVLRNMLKPHERGTRLRAARTAIGRTHVTRVGERLWIAPLRGLPALLPLSYPEWSRRITGAILARFLRRACQSLSFRQPILWFYWPYHPELVEKLRHTVSIYDCIDNHAAYAMNHHWRRLNVSAASQEARLLARVDQTFVVSPGLLGAPQTRTRRVAVAPNGVDVSVVRHALLDGTRLPELATTPRPIIGYAGVDSGRIAWGLVRRLAARNREWTFVFAGDEWHMDAGFPENVMFLGPKPYAEILRIIREFDIGIIPFALNSFTAGICPLKALDYLAVGKPVVSSPLPSVNRLEEQVPGVLTAELNPPAWEAAIVDVMQRFRNAAPISQAALEQCSTKRRVWNMYKVIEALVGHTDEPYGAWPAGQPSIRP